MPYKLRHLVLTSLFFVTATQAATDHSAYFKAFRKALALPKGAKVVSVYETAGVKEIIHKLSAAQQQEMFHGPLKYYAAGVTNSYGETLDIYNGDFSNEHKNEYLFMFTGGSLNASTIAGVFSYENNKMIPIDYKQAVIKGVLKANQDLSNFYLNIAQPYAYTLNGKTYLRYLQTPPKNVYDASKILVCTYLWQKDDFKSVGPQGCIGYTKHFHS